MEADTRLKILGHKIPGMRGIYGHPFLLPDESRTTDHVGYDGLKLI